MSPSTPLRAHFDPLVYTELVEVWRNDLRPFEAKVSLLYCAIIIRSS